MNYNFAYRKELLIVMIVTIASSLSSCSSYKKDFDDCEIPLGEKCKSLYEIHKMADEGKFDPNNSHEQSRCKSGLFGRFGKRCKHAS